MDPATAPSDRDVFARAGHVAADRRTGQGAIHPTANDHHNGGRADASSDDRTADDRTAAAEPDGPGDAGRRDAGRFNATAERDRDLDTECSTIGDPDNGADRLTGGTFADAYRDADPAATLATASDTKSALMCAGVGVLNTGL